MKIPFTQYLKPDGRTKETSIERYGDIASKARYLLDAGCRFTVEELMTMQVSLACEGKDGDVAVEVCQNGPEVNAATDKMISDAYTYIKKHPEEAF